jgi:hypothetical protein
MYARFEVLTVLPLKIVQKTLYTNHFQSFEKLHVQNVIAEKQLKVAYQSQTVQVPAAVQPPVIS